MVFHLLDVDGWLSSSSVSRVVHLTDIIIYVALYLEYKWSNCNWVYATRALKYSHIIFLLNTCCERKHIVLSLIETLLVGVKGGQVDAGFFA